MQQTRRHAALTSVSVACLVCLGMAGSAFADDSLNTKLKGYEEVPAVSSTGTGRFKAKIDKANGILHYELSFSGLEGEVRQAHIHFGQRGVNGGITLWLCQSATNPSPTPAKTPVCPQAGTVSGDLTAADVITTNPGAIAQGIAPGEFAEVLAAIRAGAAYVNVHSSKHGGGEIRGQLRDDD